MKDIEHRISLFPFLCLALAAGAMVACDSAPPGEESPGKPDNTPTEDATVGPDIGGGATPTEDTVDPQDPEDTGTGDPLGPDGATVDGAEVAPGPELIRTFIQEGTGLSQDYVLKGVWAGEAGRVVSVGNDGVVIARDPLGHWEVINSGEASDLLNDVDGATGQALWAVGKGGAIIQGSSGALGEEKPCESDAQCDDGELCTLNSCLDGVCLASPSGATGCCGEPVASYSFDDVFMDGWAASGSKGGLTWQVVSYVDPNTGQGRYTSPPGALYFGDPSQSPPNFNTGEVVGASVMSPPITLPQTGKTTLGFEVFMDTEGGGSYDVLSLEVDINGSRTVVWTKKEIPTVPTGAFVSTQADLSIWNGQTVRLVFTFDSMDSIGNEGEGTYIDDVIIDSDCSGGTQELDYGFPTLWAVDLITEDRGYAVGLGGAIVTWDGLTWKKADSLSTAITWNGLYGVQNHIVVVGSGGKILVSDGASLKMAQSPTTATLRDVHSADGETWWAVGDNGTIVEGSGSEFFSHPSGIFSHLRAVFAVSQDEVYAVGLSGVLLRYDGTSWSLVTTLPGVVKTTGFYSLWVDQGVLTITGDEGVLITGNQAMGFTYLGSVASGSALNDLWAGGGVVVAVGDDSNIFRLTTTWGAEAAPSTQNLRSVWGLSPGDIWAVGLAGLLLHWDGTAWTQVITNFGGSWEAVWGQSPTDVYAAGANGAIIHWDGTDWKTVSSQTSMNLRGVFGFEAGDTWAVGAAGTIMHLGAFGWHEQKVEPKVNADGSEEAYLLQLFDVWGAAPDDVWAVGADGGIVHWDGASWKMFETDFVITLRGLYGQGSDDIWAVGNEGWILHWNGEDWTPWPSGSVATLYDIDGDDHGHVVITGDLGTVLRLNEVPVED